MLILILGIPNLSLKYQAQVRPLHTQSLAIVYLDPYIGPMRQRILKESKI